MAFFAAFLIGAGLCIRLWFFWFVMGLLLAAPVFGGETIQAMRRLVKWPRLMGTLMFFGAGLWCYIAKEINGSGVEIFSYALAHIHYSSCNMNNFDVWQNLATSFGQFIGALSGRMLDVFTDYPLAHSEILWRDAGMGYGALLALSILCVIALSRGRSCRKAVFFVVLLLGMFLPSCVTLSAFRQNHLFILFPLPQMTMGAAACLLLMRVMEKNGFGPWLWRA